MPLLYLCTSLSKKTAACKLFAWAGSLVGFQRSRWTAGCKDSYLLFTHREKSRSGSNSICNSGRSRATCRALGFCLARHPCWLLPCNSQTNPLPRKPAPPSARPTLNIPSTTANIPYASTAFLHPLDPPDKLRSGAQFTQQQAQLMLSSCNLK